VLNRIEKNLLLDLCTGLAWSELELLLVVAIRITYCTNHFTLATCSGYLMGMGFRSSIRSS
jgi:hypothetical protein